MSEHGHHEQKKARKLASLLKNKRTQAINLQEEILGRSRELDKEREEKVRESGRSSSSKGAFAKRQEATPAWSAKMQEIRDKNTGRKSMAADRWNRFAGTESGGGRGL